MTDISNKFRVESLQGEGDYMVWADTMINLLKSEGVYRFVQKEIPEPKIPELTEHNATAVSAAEDLHSKWEMGTAKSLLTLQQYMTLGPKTYVQQQNLMKDGKPHALWTALQKKYSIVSYVLQLDLMADFHDLQLGAGGMAEFVESLRVIRSKLLAAEIDLGEFHLKAKLFAACTHLPDTVRSFLYSNLKGETHKGMTFEAASAMLLSFTKSAVPVTTASSTTAALNVAVLCTTCGSSHYGKCWGPVGSAEREKNIAAWKKKRGNGKGSSRKSEKVVAGVATVSADAFNSNLNIDDPYVVCGVCNTNIVPEGLNYYWIADSGAGRHMARTGTPTKPASHTIGCANGEILKAQGSMDVGALKDVLIVPGLAHNLASIGCICDTGGDGTQVVFTARGCRVERNGTVGAVGARIRGIYSFSSDALRSEDLMGALSTVATEALVSEVCDSDVALWHARLGHLGYSGLATLIQRSTVLGIPKAVTVAAAKLMVSKHVCKGCLLGKSHRVPIYRHVHRRASRVFDLVHTDVMGPFPCRSRGGARYVVTFFDDHTKNVWLGFMTYKSEVFDYLRRFVLRFTKGKSRVASVQWGCDLKELRSDNGGEYKSHQLSNFCKDMGIHQQFAERYTPEQNGAAERINRTLLEMANSMMKHAKPAEADLWALAFEAAAYTRMRCLSSSGHPTKSPYELLTGQKPDLSNMRVWGCLCYVYIHSEKRKKMMDTSYPCRFVGYDDNGYKVVNCATGKVEITREIVRFDETVFDMKSVVSVTGATGGEGSVLESLLETPSLPGAPDVSDTPDVSDASVVPVPVPESSDVPVPTVPPVVPEVPYESDGEEGALPAVPVGPVGPVVPELSYESDGDEDFAVPETPSESEVVSSVSSAPVVRRSERVEESTSRPDYSQNRPYTRKSVPSCSLGSLPNPDNPPSSSTADEVFLSMFASSEPTSSGSSWSKPALVEDDNCPYRTWANNVDVWAYAATSLNDDRIPKSFEEAQCSPHWLEWKAAIDSELKSLLKHQTWDEIDESVQPGDYDNNIVGSRWVFDIKTDKDGNILRYKARLVAQGFTQVEGVDYKETYAPVANRTTLRLVMSLAAQMDLELEHMDVCTAFLNATLPEDERMHMRLPPGVVPKGKSSIVKLLRCLYGLKQSPREWNKVINAFLIKLGYTRCKMDPCLYIYKDTVTGVFSFILLYVDDLIMGSSSVTHMQELKSKFNAEYDMKDLGALSYCLGLSFNRDRKARILEMDQEKYIGETLDLFDMSECWEASTPADPNVVLSSAQSPKSRKDIEYMSKIPYREAIGRVIYLMCCTRPDIAFAVNSCARYMEDPGIDHWNAVLRILRFLKRTMGTRLTFGRMVDDCESLGASGYSLLNEQNCKAAKHRVLLGFSDADFAGCSKSRNSTTGYIFFFNGPLSWCCKLQLTPAQSPCEAEYMALCAAGNESRWLSQLMNEILPSLCEDVVIFEDNTSTISLANNGKISPRTKHIDVKYHVLQEYIGAGYLRLLNCGTKYMCADAFTKNLGSTLASVHSKTNMG